MDVDNPELKLRPGMTATVNIITGEAKGVLRIPNAALRFTPNLPAEDLAKIMKEAGERMFAKRQAEGGAPQAEGGVAPAPATAAAPGTPSVQGGQTGGPRMFGQGGGGAQRSGRRPSTVWYLDAAGKLTVSFIRPGVADSSFTELLRSELKEGQEIITGLNGTSASTAATAGGPQRAGR